MAEKTKKEYSNVAKLGKVKKSELNRDGIFMIVNVEDKYRIGMAGRWMTNQIFDSSEEAEAYIQNKPWELIMNLAGTIAEFVVQNQGKNN